MIKKVLCLSIALVAVSALASASFADDVAKEGSKGETVAVTTTAAPGCPCRLCDPCHPPVVYHVGPFGVVRPVVYAPVFRPVYYPPRLYYRAWCAPVYPCGCGW
jgi:hypothetical protein